MSSSVLDKKKVLELIEKGDSFRGKKIGKIDFNGVVFEKSVNFSGAIFTEDVSFGESKFHKSVNFRRAIFQKNCIFLGAEFFEKTDFSHVKFDKWAYFWKARFHTDADFIGAIFLGKSNFSFALFEDEAKFCRVKFLGPTWFWKTLFFGNVSFEESFFGDEATFEGSEDEICISKNDLDQLLIEKLIATGRFTRNTEDLPIDISYFRKNTIYANAKISLKDKNQINEIEGYLLAHFTPEEAKRILNVFHLYHKKMFAELDGFTLYNKLKDYNLIALLFKKKIIKKNIQWPNCIGFNHNIKNKDQLKKYLDKITTDRSKIELILDLWQRSNKKISFSHVYFKNPQNVRFIGVNLNKCILLNSNVPQADFTDVRWNIVKSFLIRRNTVYDEVLAHKEKNFNFVEKLYMWLRKSYETRYNYAEAGDFFYGEMEMRRLNNKGRINYVLLTIYKYLSGYGEVHILAFVWLIFAVLVLFPFIYILAGLKVMNIEIKGFNFYNYITALLHSLEISVFKKSDTIMSIGFVGVFTEIFQRSFIALQTPLFFLAVKRRFMRQ